MSNQQALEQMLRLWHQFQTHPEQSFDRGKGRWKQLFSKLRSVRRWGVSDRLQETGVLKDWQKRIEQQQQLIRFEIELWFRKSQDKTAIRESIENHVAEVQGSIVAESIIEEIRYHGLLCQLPLGSVRTIINDWDARLLKCEQVMYFRPTGQIACPAPSEVTLAAAPERDLDIDPEALPVTALLDGMPLQNHTLLAGRLSVDDPDGFAADCPAGNRVHGTGMASLIIHGELGSNEEALQRPLYVRPILKPDQNDWINNPPSEVIPNDILAVDLVHGAVRRLFENIGEEPPVAPSIRIINLSVGDPEQVFTQSLSAWARLLDWLAWKYQVLFIVSAGNQVVDVELGLDQPSILAMLPSNLESSVLKSIAGDIRNRRIFSPAESVNALTVGSAHQDVSVFTNLHGQTNLIEGADLLSPISGCGMGYRRSVKPELLMPGGRQLYRVRNAQSDATTYGLSTTSSEPGQEVACPGVAPGDLTRSFFTRGTSNAAALATRTASQLIDVISALQNEPGGDQLEDKYIAVLIKTLLVHGAMWGEAYVRLRNALLNDNNRSKFREYTSRFIGYGLCHRERLPSCTEERATLLGCGSLNKGEAHKYSFPLPPSLSGRTEWRRLTVTLTWLTPTNVQNRKYRKAHLWFETDGSLLDVNRSEVDARVTQPPKLCHE